MRKKTIRIAVAAVSGPAIANLAAFQKEYEGSYPDAPKLDWQVFAVSRPVRGSQEKLAEAVRMADLAVIDLMGAPEELVDRIHESLKECRGQRIVIGSNCRDLTRLGRFSMSGMGKKSSGKKRSEAGSPAGNPQKDNGREKSLQEEQKNRSGKSPLKMMHMMRRMSMMLGAVVPAGMPADMKNLFRLIDYWQQAGAEDIRSFMFLILRNYFGIRQLPKPKPCSMRYGIWLKDEKTGRLYANPQGYCRSAGFRKERPTVAVCTYGHRYPNDFSPAAEAIRQGLDTFANVLNIVFSQNEDKDLEKLEQFLSIPGYPVQAVVNLMPFRLGAGPMGGDANRAVEILKKIKAPYFKPFCMTRTDPKSWEEGQVQNPGEFLINVLLPELDGGICMMPAGVTQEGKGTGETADIAEIIPIEERIRMLILRIKGVLCLQQKPNPEKRIVFVCYSNPPGEDSLFGGAFLDTTASMAAVLCRLKQEGYDTEQSSAGEIREDFLGSGIVNGPAFTDAGAPFALKQIGDGAFPIYAKEYGKILIALQPLRSENMDDAAIHDKNTPPPASYRAFYQWIKEDYKADAVVHVGTHGTLEFLPGRESAMTGSCWPDRLIADLPHYYLYYLGNPSEAMIAKRRSHAVLISYQPPKFKKSGLYGQYAGLKELIDEYRESRISAPEKCADLLTAIQESAEGSGLWPDSFRKKNNPQEQGIPAEVPIDELEEELYRFERSLIPDGLHVFGREDSGAQKEMEGLLDALSGKYLPAGKAGDVFKSGDLFPSGRNLVQFDPRLIPTKTAFERGAKAAKLLLQRYHSENGCWPKKTAVILWGLETSRSQGETIGQIMEYLGIRLKQKAGKFDDRFEIIPAEELAHPRVDVLIQICGFFRDMFPNLLENLTVMLRKLDERNEPEECSSFAENTKRVRNRLIEKGIGAEEAAELARGRIFGPAPGQYATGLTEQVRRGSWKTEETLGETFVTDLSYLYTEHTFGRAGRDLLEEEYESVEMISQIKSLTDYELTDLDHYYEFYGGLSRAVENVRGEKPALYIADTTQEEVCAEALQTSLKRGIGTRLLNPVWIDGMMRHGYHGVQQINRRFENVLGFAAATGEITDDIFSRMESVYVADRERQQQLREANRWGYLSMLERLMEANNRGYWNAGEEELREIREAYLKTEGETET